MKSKGKIPVEFGQKPSEYLKNSSFNFLENERSHVVVERGHVDQRDDEREEVVEAKNTNVKQKILPAIITSDLTIIVSDKPVIVNPQEVGFISTTEERTVCSSYGPKKYVTICYFQPKQKPVYYSETMIVNIGSKNKKYFESIYYENKLLPVRWTEKMTTIIPDKEPVLIKSDANIPIEKPAFHYISLQQPEEQLPEVAHQQQQPELQSHSGIPAA